MGWDLSVLKRALPEIEAAAVMSERMAEGFRSQQESMARGRAHGDQALEEARTALHQSREEAAALRARNAELEREIATLRRVSAASADLAPRTPLTADMTGRRGSGSLLSPLSPLLRGLDESADRTRGSAYWRRARMCLKVASIADYWQTQSQKRSAAHMGTPMPGRMPGHAGSVALPQPADAPGESQRALMAVTRRMDAAVGEAAAVALLKLELKDAAPDGSELSTGKSPGKKQHKRTSERVKAEMCTAAAQAAAEEIVASARDEPLPGGMEKGTYMQKISELAAGASTGTAFAEAMSRCPSQVGAILASSQVVIDQNIPPLTAHLRTILKDGIAAAVRSLQAKAASGSAPATEESAKAKGATVMATLDAAVDNVQQQFASGLRSSVPPAMASQLNKELLDTLCDLAVRDRCDRLRTLTSIEEAAARIWEEVAIVQDFVSGVSKVGPQPWLLSLILQEKSVGLPEPLAEYIETHIATHLDPYIDGDITSEVEERGTSPMYIRLCEAYEQSHGRELPAPPEVVLALYVRHGVCKADATQCFTDLVMGQGRLPIPGTPQQRHAQALGKALSKAIVKDFGEGHSKIQGVKISAQLIEELSMTHSTKLFADHQTAAERLAEANRIGELGRKDEMKRIFGIEI